MTGEKIASTLQMRAVTTKSPAYTNFTGATFVPEGEQEKNSILPRDCDEPYRGQLLPVAFPFLSTGVHLSARCDTFLSTRVIEHRQLMPWTDPRNGPAGAAIAGLLHRDQHGDPARGPATADPTVKVAGQAPAARSKLLLRIVGILFTQGCTDCCPGTRQ
jgi:hypothetical protein